MNRFRQFQWYIGACMIAVALLLSVVTRNWVLAILCAVSTTGLQKLDDKVELPKVYTQRGIENEWFTPGRQQKRKR